MNGVRLSTQSTSAAAKQQNLEGTILLSVVCMPYTQWSSQVAVGPAIHRYSTFRFPPPVYHGSQLGLDKAVGFGEASTTRPSWCPSCVCRALFQAAPLRCSAVPVVQSLLHMIVCVTWLQVLAGALHPLWPVPCTHVLPLRCPVQKPGWSSSLLQASTCSLKIGARVDRNGLSSLPDIVGVSAAGLLASWCKSAYSIAWQLSRWILSF